MAGANCMREPMLVPVRITPAIDREFRRQELFPDLRIEKAKRVVNGLCARFEIPLNQAEKMLVQVECLWYGKAFPRGAGAAYGALVKSLRIHISNAKRIKAVGVYIGTNDTEAVREADKKAIRDLMAKQTKQKLMKQLRQHWATLP